MKKILSLALVCAMLLTSALAFTGCQSPVKSLPIVCGETGMNDLCGVATYGVDYYSLGVKAGDMAADILINGADPATMPVATDPNPALSVNTELAEQIGFEIPQAILDRATGGQTQEVTRVESAIVSNGADYVVGILQLLPHVALDQANKGFQDQLSVRMAAAGKTVKIYDNDASGEDSNNMTIATTYVTQNVDLIYTIATSSSVAAMTATEGTDIPVLFNAVTNPLGEGLVASMSAPGGNVTGVSDINPVEAQLDLIAELTGKANPKIGFLYTSAETNSVFQVKTLGIPHCESKGYTYVESGIVDITNLQSAMMKLQQAGVDAIYIPTDNLLANSVATVHELNCGD